MSGLGRGFKWLWDTSKDVWNDATSSNSYSDYVNKANERTNGWYGTLAGSIPVAGGLHRAILERDRVNDMLKNSGQSWGDVIGYNSLNALSGASSGLSSSARDGMKIADGVHDLYEFYTGEKGQEIKHQASQLRAVRNSLRK